MKKVYLKVFMDKNFGDDLMLIKLIKTFPNTRFYVYCNLELFDFYYSLLKEFMNYELTTTELRHVNKFGRGYFDLIILMGGSVLQGTRNKGCYYRARNILALKVASFHGTPYAIIGCNTGPFINRLTQYFVALELRTARLITTRDKASFTFISNIQTKADIYLFSDLLMNFDNEHLLEKECEEKCPTLGISVLNSTNPRLSNGFVTEYFVSIIDEYIEKTNGIVYILAFNVGKQDDLLLANDIYQLVRNKDNTKIISHGTNYLSIPNAIIQCSEVLAVRFHAIILGSILGVKTIPIIYSNKTENLLNDLDYQGERLYIDKLDEKEVSELVNKIINEEYRLNVDENIKNESNKHMEALSKFLL